MSVADELQKLAALKSAGDLTPEEFDEQKRRLLSGHSAPPPPPPQQQQPSEVRTDDQKKSKAGVLFIGLLVGLALLALFGGLSPESKPEGARRVPHGAVGVLPVDSGTEYVFLEQRSSIGGACEGWNAVSIQPPSRRDKGNLLLMCWQERGGQLHTASREAVSATVAPMSAIR